MIEYWVNIDIKEEIYRLHKSTCRHVKKYPSETKGIQELKIRGGWLRFKTKPMANAFYQRDHNTLRWKPCKVCNP